MTCASLVAFEGWPLGNARKRKRHEKHSMIKSQDVTTTRPTRLRASLALSLHLAILDIVACRKTEYTEPAMTYLGVDTTYCWPTSAYPLNLSAYSTTLPKRSIHPIIHRLGLQARAEHLNFSGKCWHLCLHIDKTHLISNAVSRSLQLINQVSSP